ncbi:MAG: IS3 family transposase [Burkholderiales bacterium]
MIDRLRRSHPVNKLCDLLDVAESGYQAWSAGKVIPPRKREEARLLLAIQVAHQRGRGTYGPGKLQSELAVLGLTAGIKRIKRLRKLHGIRCTHKKKFKVTTDSRHNLPIAPNRLDRQFNYPTAPNQE